MRRIFRIELRNTFCNRNRKTLLFFILISAIAWYIDYTEYNSIKSEKIEFQEYEKSKLDRYLSYEQYGGFGFRVLFEPSPLVINLGSNYPIKIDSNIDTLETIDINSNIRGKYLFKRGILNFHNIYYIIGAFIIFMYGFYTFRSLISTKIFPTSRYIWLTIFSRIIIVSCLFWGLNLFFGFLSYTQIDIFTSHELSLLLAFNCYFNLIIILSLILGLALSYISFYKNISIKFSIGFWLIFFLFLPRIHSLYLEIKSNSISSIDKINSQKSKNLLEFERQARKALTKMANDPDIKNKMKGFANKFTLDIFKKNLQIEIKLRESIDELINTNEKISSFIPSVYSTFLSEEISGSSPRGFEKFFDYILDYREKFLLYYIKQRYTNNNDKIIPFKEPWQTIYTSKPELPKNFLFAFVMAVFWILAIYVFLAILINLQRKNNTFDFEMLELFNQKAQSHVILCENEVKKSNLFSHFHGRKGYQCIYNFKIDDFNRNISPSIFFQNLIEINGADAKDAANNLEILGIHNINNEKCFSDELLKKIFCAVVFASDCHTVIIDSLLKGESDNFEKSLLNFFLYQLDRKQFFYITTDMYSLKAEKDITVKNIPLTKSRLNKISFR